MTDAISPILGIWKLPLAELLVGDLGTMMAGAKGQLMLGLPAGKRIWVGDDALLVDHDLDAREDITAVTYEAIDYAIDIDIECLQDIISVHDADDTVAVRLKSLLYCIEFDAYYDGSTTADESWVNPGHNLTRGRKSPARHGSLILNCSMSCASVFHASAARAEDDGGRSRVAPHLVPQFLIGETDARLDGPQRQIQLLGNFAV
jgi:hypothetical protein